MDDHVPGGCKQGQAHHLHLGLDRSARWRCVLEGVNLDIHAGDFVGLSGPNGSGKSTLLMTIVGELEPCQGTWKSLVKSPEQRPRVANCWVSQAAAQLPSNLKISVRELVALGTMSWIDMLLPFRRTNRAQRVEKPSILSACRMSRIETCSSFLEPAAACRGRSSLATNAEVLILDEPLAGVDRASRDEFLKLLDGAVKKERPRDGDP